MSRTPLLVAFAFAASACASSGTTPAPTTTMTPTTTRVQNAAGSTIAINTVSVNSGSNTLIVADMEATWGALKAIYGELGIPVTTLVDAQHTIGNDGYKVRRRIGKLAMQNLLDCGGASGMPNAETYDIFLTISSVVTKNPKAGVNLMTRIDASGKSPNFNRDQNVACATTGELEKAIAEMVRKKLGA